MPAPDRLQLARDAYGAYGSGDRDVIERLMADDLTFWSPLDDGIDRATYFERCWPNADTLASFDIVRLVESGDEVLVTYEATKADGKRFRNTEVLTFDGDRISRVEVYFGWDLSSAPHADEVARAVLALHVARGVHAADEDLVAPAGEAAAQVQRPRARPAGGQVGRAQAAHRRPEGAVGAQEATGLPGGPRDRHAHADDLPLLLPAAAVRRGAGEQQPRAGQPRAAVREA